MKLKSLKESGEGRENNIFEELMVNIFSGIQQIHRPQCRHPKNKKYEKCDIKAHHHFLKLGMKRIY